MLILRESEEKLSIWDSILVKGIWNGLFEGMWAWIWVGIENVETKHKKYMASGMECRGSKMLVRHVGVF